MSEITTTTIDDVQTGSPVNWSAFDAMTEKQRSEAANSDPACPPASAARLNRSRNVSNPRLLRRRLGLDLDDFAIRFGIPVGRLKHWESGGYHNDPIARTLLQVIDREPDAVTRAISRIPTELYDDYGVGGFMVPGHAELRPIDSNKPLRMGLGKVGIDFTGVHGETLMVTNLHDARLAAAPRFHFSSFMQECIPRIGRHQLEFSFELEGASIGVVEHEIGREKYEAGPSSSDQELESALAHCKVEKSGMRLQIEGVVREACQNDQSELNFHIDAMIEWRVLRFLMPKHWVLSMYSLVYGDS